MADIYENHTYKIVNVKSGTVLDLSGTDHHTISGWNDHGGDNQKWHFGKQNNQWTLRNVAYGRYLGLSDSYNFQDGNRLQGVHDPFGWNISRDEKNHYAFRLSVPEHRANVDLDLGNAANGTKVHLWGQWDTPQQTWRFEEV